MSATPLPRDEEVPNEPSEPALELIDESGIYIAIGDVIAGKYRVEEVLGIGGMAFVLSAKHVELDERFALKFLARQFLGEPALIERFTQEARSACRLRSEHIARVYDVGSHEGAPFIVMEHLQGRDLCTVVHEGGPLRIIDAVEYAMQACEALATAHRHGIVHRDIKPENLFLVEQEGLPSIKLLDFGISKVALSDGEAATRLTGNLTLGTPCYMAPEQIRSSASADARSDLWSLGVVLYELLAGTEAFRAPSITEVCAAVLERDPEPLERIRTDIPTELADIVMRCLEKAPEDRFANVAELAEALLPFAPTRALLSAERSSSLMRAVATPGDDVRISSVRPALQMGRHRSSGRVRAAARSDESPPSSAVPFTHVVDELEASSVAPKKRRGFVAVFGLAAIAAGTVLFVVYGRPAAPPAVEHAPAVTVAAETSTATTPIAIRSAAAAATETAAPSPPPPKRREPTTPSASVAKPRPPAGSAATVTSSSDLPKAAPTSASTVELGY
jgi:serine/threonine protein kinase